MNKFISNNFVIPSSTLGTFGELIGERWERFEEKDLTDYFEKGFNKFLNRLQAFRQSDLSSTQEKELRFMLDSLIYAKQKLTTKRK